MSSWSSRRQLLYSLIPLVLLGFFSFFIYTKYFTSAPSCFDGVKNGTETGVDCGGTCSLLCRGDAIAPVVLWSKSFAVTGGVWNAVAYVQNPNTGSSAKNVPYEFRLYDKNNILIVRRQGHVSIPNNTTFVIFENGLNAFNKDVARTDFEFSQSPQWVADTSKQPPLKITNNPVENATTSPKITGEAMNTNLRAVGPFELTALILDGNGNAISASKTQLDPISPGQTVPFVFTWPHPFPVTHNTCQTPSNVMLVIDTSKNMQYASLVPPQPLTDIKKITANFLSQFHVGDMVGIVSFATSVSDPINQKLTGNLDLVKNALSSLTISTSTHEQGTNIGAGLQSAVLELNSATPSVNAKKVIILVTGGIPTEPQMLKEVNYPTIYAENIASDARVKNISIYTVGLGQNIDPDVLTNIAGSDGRFFSVADTTGLPAVYQTIGDSLCEQKPQVIEILSRMIEN